MGADPRFHHSSGAYSLAAILAASGARCAGEASHAFTGVAPLQSAGPDEVSFLDNRRYLAALHASRAGAVVLQDEHAAEVPPGCLALVSANPYLAYARIAGLFHPAAAPRPGIHPTAVVAADVELGAGCEIGPYAVLGAGVKLGARCVVGPHAVLGDGCVFGDDCRLHAHASAHCTIAGNRVVLHGGARVGQEGFSFATTAEGRFVSMPQLGRVRLGDEVEVGANSCIDRGSGHDTVLGPGTRIDNLVQIAHNVTTGRGCVLAGQVGIAGSTALGDFVQMGGQVGVIGHLSIGSKVRIGAQSGVSSDLPDGGDYLGSPAWPAMQTRRVFATWRRLAGLKRGGKPGA